MHMDLDSKEPLNQISALGVKCNWEISSMYAFHLFSAKIYAKDPLRSSKMANPQFGLKTDGLKLFTKPLIFSFLTSILPD